LSPVPVTAIGKKSQIIVDVGGYPATSIVTTIKA
jgi:hypothetical protein